MNHSRIVSFIWGGGDELIRDTSKRGKYQDVILPLTVLRRLDCVLAPTKRKVLAVQARFRGKLDNLDSQLQRASGFAFYNTSRYDFEKLLADAPHVAQNLRNSTSAGSAPTCARCSRSSASTTPSRSSTRRASFQIVQRFGDAEVDLHPDAVDNAAMGTIFEELIRKFNEALNEDPGEHFTAARHRPPHGRPAAGRRPEAVAHEGRRAQRLRPVLRAERTGYSAARRGGCCGVRRHPIRLQLTAIKRRRRMMTCHRVRLPG